MNPHPSLNVNVNTLVFDEKLQENAPHGPLTKVIVPNLLKLPTVAVTLLVVVLGRVSGLYVTVPAGAEALST